MRRQTPAFGRNDAESLAIQALTFLVDEPARLARFLALTGIDAAEVRALARTPGFLAAVLEHLRGDERLLRAFADQAGRDPAEVARAHALLAGPEWERDSA